MKRRSTLAALVADLQLCGRHGHLAKAREVHARLVTYGLHASPFAITSLISLYSRLALPSLALAVFRSSSLHQPPNLFAWNAAVASLASNGLSADALLLFRRLRREAPESPDGFTYPCVIKACADLGAAGELRTLHGCLLKSGLGDDVFLASALVHANLKLGLVVEAQKVFDELSERDVVLWNTLVNGFAQMGRFASALEYFGRMLEEGMCPSKFTITGILSVFTARADLTNGRKIHSFAVKTGHATEVAAANALIDLYGKCHAVEDAAEIFAAMEDTQRDLFSWNSMLSALQYSADHVGTLQLFAHMRNSSILADVVTVAAVLPACGQYAALRLGREIHAYVFTSGIASAIDVFASNAVVDMYAKSGALYDARYMFDRMPERDVATWNIMIDGYATHGQGEEALQLFNRMTAEEGLAPNEITMLGALAACSHAGLVDQGRQLLTRMTGEFGVPPGMEHYSCVADMFGRARMLDEAKQVAESAGPLGSGAWRAYLAACRTHGETERVVEAARRLQGFEDQEVAGSGGWVLLSHAYGLAGSYEEVEEVRGEMRRRGVQKAAPGCSWLDVGGGNGERGGVRGFLSGDRSHLEVAGVHEMLQGLDGRMRECSEDVLDWIISYDH